MHRSYFFVRHARAIYQDRGFRVGDHPEGTDWSLSPRGPAQARALAPFLMRSGVTRLVSSSLRRARETARHISEVSGLPHQHAWPELNEVSPHRLIRPDAWGPLQKRLGHRIEWLHAIRMVRSMRSYLGGGSPAPFDGIEGVHDRIQEVLARLDAFDEPRVAVVSHGYWILLASLSLEGPLRARWIDNCSVTRVDADGRGAYRLVSFAQRIR